MIMINNKEKTVLKKIHHTWVSQLLDKRSYFIVRGVSVYFCQLERVLYLCTYQCYQLLCVVRVCFVLVLS